MPAPMSNRIALGRVQLRESYVMHETADIFVSYLTQFAQTTPDQGTALEVASMEHLEQAYGFGPQRETERKPFVYQDGFAIIPVHGALINRFGGSWGFVTGYQYIRRVFNAALEDDDVKVIVFDIDSPGGEAAGCFELAEEIRKGREIKPSLAVVDSLAASAGYAIPSACTRMVATPSSKIGSIGVIRMHMNVKGALDQMGVEVTIIEAPEDGMKSAGSPFRSLTADEKKDFQAQVNRAYDDFVSLIVANRGLNDNEVRETKAKVYRADEALALRLIDAVKTPAEAVSSFLAELADDDDPEEPNDEEMNMAQESKGSEATSTAVAAAAVATADQIAAAVTADRERMTAIKALPESAERPKLADTLALGGYTVDQAKTLLTAAAPEPKAVVTAPAAPVTEATSVDTTNHLAAAMDKSKQPEVGAGGGDGAGTGEETPETMAATILRDQGSIVGRNFGEAKAA